MMPPRNRTRELYLNLLTLVVGFGNSGNVFGGQQENAQHERDEREQVDAPSEVPRDGAEDAGHIGGHDHADVEDDRCDAHHGCAHGLLLKHERDNAEHNGHKATEAEAEDRTRDENALPGKRRAEERGQAADEHERRSEQGAYAIAQLAAGNKADDERSGNLEKIRDGNHIRNGIRIDAVRAHEPRRSNVHGTMRRRDKVHAHQCSKDADLAGRYLCFLRHGSSSFVIRY